MTPKNKKKRKIDDLSTEELQAPIVKKRRDKRITRSELTNIIASNIDATLEEGVELSEQLTELAKRITNVKEAIDEIESNADLYRQGVFAPDSSRTVLSRLNNGLAKLTNRETEKKQLKERRDDLAGRMIELPSSEGTAYSGDGDCHIRFVNVGMGDCTLISTPEGKKIMIDLGSDSVQDAILNTVLDTDLNPDGKATTELETYAKALDFISDRIKSKIFLNGESAIDILLLTHPDKDHHKYLKPILKDKIRIQTIGMAYYSGAEDIISFAHGSSEFLKTATTAKKVTLCEESTKDDTGHIVLTKTIDDRPLAIGKRKAATVGEEFIDATTGAIVVYYEESEKSNFKISLLSGNVKGVWNGTSFVQNDADLKGPGEMKLNSTAQNRGSLVICIECFGKMILVCGDATAVTEKFIVNHFAATLGTNNLLQKVNYLRVAHHGSPTSSARFFLAPQTNLKRAVVSTGGKNTVKHKLPKKRIIQDYVDNTLLSSIGKTVLPPAHTIYCFEKDESPRAVDDFKDIHHEVFATGSSGTVALVLKK